MKKYTFLILVSLICSVNMTHSMQYPNYIYNPINYKNMPLHMAVYLGDYEKVKFLLELNTSQNLHVNQQDINGDTPLHIAAGKGYIQITQLLLAHGARNIINRQSYSPADIASANRDSTLDITKANQYNAVWKIITEYWINQMNELL